MPPCPAGVASGGWLLVRTCVRDRSRLRLRSAPQSDRPRERDGGLGDSSGRRCVEAAGAFIMRLDSQMQEVDDAAGDF